MALDVASHIYTLATQQRQQDLEALKASSRRLVRFEVYVSVEVPPAAADDDERPVQIMCEAKAPAMILHKACLDKRDHWHIEYEGTQYDITAFPQSISFVLRCIVDELLSRLFDELAEKGLVDIVAPTEIELCAYTRFGSSSSGGTTVRPWTHTFGRLFKFSDTYEDTYETALQRYILSLGKHVVQAGQAVQLVNNTSKAARLW